MASSTCCKNGLWSPISGLRSCREQLDSRKSRVEFRVCGNSAARTCLGAVQGLACTHNNFSAATFGSVGKESCRLWLRVLCRSSNLQLSNGSEMTGTTNELARVYDTGSKYSQRPGSFISVFNSLEVASDDIITEYSVPTMVLAISALVLSPGPANATTLNPAYGDVGALLEAGVQLIYLGALITLLGVGSFLVVRQVLIKRELETAAKDLQERVRSGDASSLEYFELGAVMLRKKYYQLANKYLDQAIKKWDGSEQDLAQVYNALGFSYFSDGKREKAIAQYEKAVQLQPGYVIAWNNLADAYENQKEFSKALKAYDQALQLDPTNKIASARRDSVKSKVDRFQGIP